MLIEENNFVGFLKLQSTTTTTKILEKKEKTSSKEVT